MSMISAPAGKVDAGRARHRVSDTELTFGDRVLRVISGIAAVVPTAILVLIAVVMFVSALPSIIYSGFSFFTGSVFNFGNLYATTTITHNGIVAPPHAVYGVFPLIIGTLATSVIALVLAVPISVGGVLMLSEIVPRRISDSLAVFLELLAGIPSVVFGLWGVAVFGPFLSAHVYPVLTGIGHVIPFLKGPVGQGQGLLTASLVLTVMIIPIVASTTRELLRRVPILAKEGALALGMTRYETVRVVTIPYIRTGIVAASLLGWARALGETIAVLLIIGDIYSLPNNIFGNTSTIAAWIASTLDGALGDVTGAGVHALAELGLLLLGISLITNFAGRLVVRKVSGGVLPVGRGV
jgi:phosphate transport system permease protein